MAQSHGDDDRARQRLAPYRRFGSVDFEGYLTLKDPSKDLIISGGSNIYPREVEEALLLHPDVAEVAVVGRTHHDRGEEVVACIVARGAAMTDEQAQELERVLDTWCLDRIARFKRPKAYVFLAELPKNNTGKVLKTELSKPAAQRGGRWMKERGGGEGGSVWRVVVLVCGSWC